jgi:Tfp pilus assembly protein PilF
MKKRLRFASNCSSVSRIMCLGTLPLPPMEKMEDARAEIAEALRVDPKYTVKVVPRSFPWKDQGEIDLLIESLRKAGLPDKPPPGQP